MMTWAAGAPHRYEDLKRRAVTTDIGGRRVRAAGVDDLIAMKRAAGRPKDQLALLQLEDLKRLADQLDPE